MANITSELAQIRSGIFGSQIREALYSAIKKINEQSESTSIVVQDITIPNNESLSFTLEIEGLTQDLTGAFLAIDTSYTHQVPKIVASMEDNTIFKEDEGVYGVHVSYADMVDLDIDPGDYIYEFWVIIGDDAYMLMKGQYTVLPALFSGV